MLSKEGESDSFSSFISSIYSAYDFIKGSICWFNYGLIIFEFLYGKFSKLMALDYYIYLKLKKSKFIIVN